MTAIGSNGFTPQVASVREVLAPFGPPSAAGAAAAAMTTVVDRIVATVARDSGFPRQDAVRIWGQLAEAATGARPANAATGARADDPYGVGPVARELSRTLGDPSASAQGKLEAALDRFAAAVTIEVVAGRQGSAAKALGPVAIAIAGALGGAADAGADAAAALVNAAAARLEAG